MTDITSQQPPPSQSSSSPKEPPTPPPNQSWTSTRSLRQASLFLAGATFLTASTLLTRRTITKRHLAIHPPRFTPSNSPPRNPPNGALEAVQALQLATLNVAAWGMMMVGGVGWAMDISTLEDLRRKVRGGLGVDGTGREEGEVEEEFEEWLAGVLERKKGKEERRRARGEEEGEKRWVNERGRER